jgi:hypothetical protein
MGAPGHYILCPKGHEIGVIEDDLYWNDEMFKRLEELEKKKCPICGQNAKYNFCHYGSIDDCIDVKLAWNSKENRWIIPSKLTESQEKELKDHIIKKDRTIKTEKVTKKDAGEVAENAENVVAKIDGTEISQMRCRKTELYHHNLEAKVGDEIYMINTTAVLRMANEFRFDIVQGKKHRYLVPVEKFENGTYVSMDK